mmetsp:Transcript_34830/g.42013  ORF Transcript_34830/g.42013 Transcript_34830/m.42013 type:complete len:706 (-) Transcript_34830:156-2273(-)|eukprot:CAMPEP_0194359996 /NCGR_PEP_ID=MMETSP0174-20130528/7270_1 /TAXON_ID=216777 /ORGANISM="Proboscia alata, Strain PI-D3" /LENGTH=705 /DNA_ID=CAMNT_0039131221 /DNA_START=48 /DNA_END=2165 /DNA_ORIENTATION=-
MRFSNYLVAVFLIVFGTGSSAFTLATSGRSVHNVSSDRTGVTPHTSTSTAFLPRIIGGGTGLQSSATESDAKTAAACVAISGENLALLYPRGREAIQSLIENDATIGAQTHVFSDWPSAGTDDELKIKLSEQIADLNESYPGGLKAYLSKARTLLKESADGVNPFTEYEALIPEGENLRYEETKEGNMSFGEAEDLGLENIGDAAFVLVAGGLGERLGYSGIKLSLETDLCTNQSYLEEYVRYIQALQHSVLSKSGKSVQIPLAIMTSGDTDEQTRVLLKKNSNFGMEESQISIICQDKVPALKDGSAGLAMKESWTIETKPHGHGDVHHLLLKSGLVDKWLVEGKRHVVFIQDTNALVVNGVLPTLGVSVDRGFHMNSICIPRLAGEAAGAITKLAHKSDPNKSLVINVEYNQLDPLLLGQGDRKGDVADPSSGFSPFPGNANNLVLELASYAKTLKGEDEGVVVEFVNPKYKDETRTEFKKPTRLECMMQDFPKLLQKEMGKEANVGFTMLDRWLTFSPAKNSLEAGVESCKNGSTAPGTMSSAESEKYIQNQRKLRHAGVSLPVTEEDDLVLVSGITVTPGPRIILAPSFSVSQKETKEKIQGGSITEKSSLILEGGGLIVKNLDLDGALIIRTGPSCEVTVDGLKVQNKGWVLEENSQNSDLPESVAIRGYTMRRYETKEIIIEDPGRYFIGEDGVVNKLD